MNKDLVEIEAELIKETNAAYLIDDGGGEVWVPKSQLEEVEINGTEISFMAPEWLAQDKGLI